MEFDAGTWWLIGILLTFLIGALGWMVKRSLDKIERKLDSAATKAELEKEVGECKQQISEIQHTYTTRSQHQQDEVPDEIQQHIPPRPLRLAFTAGFGRFGGFGWCYGFLFGVGDYCPFGFACHRQRLKPCLQAAQK